MASLWNRTVPAFGRPCSPSVTLPRGWPECPPAPQQIILTNLMKNHTSMLEIAFVYRPVPADGGLLRCAAPPRLLANPGAFWAVLVRFESVRPVYRAEIAHQGPKGSLFYLGQQVASRETGVRTHSLIPGSGQRSDPFARPRSYIRPVAASPLSPGPVPPIPPGSTLTPTRPWCHRHSRMAIGGHAIDQKDRNFSPIDPIRQLRAFLVSTTRLAIVLVMLYKVIQ